MRALTVREASAKAGSESAGLTLGFEAATWPS